MRTLTTAAVYGLVAVPPMPDTQTCSENDNRPVTVEDVNCSQLVCPQRVVATKGMAATDELARIRKGANPAQQDRLTVVSRCNYAN
jgi:hypothetical protein